MPISDIILITHHSIIWIWIVASFNTILTGTGLLKRSIPLGLTLGIIGLEDFIYQACSYAGLQFTNPQVILCFPVVIFAATLTGKLLLRHLVTPWVLGMSISGLVLIVTTYFFHQMTVGYTFTSMVELMISSSTPDRAFDVLEIQNDSSPIGRIARYLLSDPGASYICSYNDISNTPFCLALDHQGNLGVYEQGVIGIHKTVHILMYSLCLAAHSVWVIGSFSLITFHLNKFKKYNEKL